MRWIGVLAAGLLLALLSWNGPDPAPMAGLDPSWGSALHRAIHDGLAWGDDVLFTYGPLGFLDVPVLWYGTTGALAIVYGFVTRVALLSVLWVVARESFGRPVGALLVLVAGGACAQVGGGGEWLSEPVIVLAFAAGLLFVLNPPAQRGRLAFAAGAGALSALEVLAKLNVGATVALLTLIALLGPPAGRVRLVAAWAGGAIGGLLVLWLLAGQPLGALDDYVRGGIDIVLGYSPAQALEQPGRAWEYSAAAVIFVAGCLALLEATASRPERVRGAVLALWVALSFMTFKEAFVRHDIHGPIFFATMLPAVLAFPWRPQARLAGFLAFALVFCALLASAEKRLDDVISPFVRAADAYDQLSLVVRPHARARITASGRADIVADDRLDPGTLALLRGHTVHVAYSEAAVAWAYGLKWRPVPVFQSYQAYTPALDRRNGDALRSSKAPDRILLAPPKTSSVDGRLPQYDSPQMTLAMLCRYDLARATRRWAVLTRGRDRCGAQRPLATVAADWGQVVPVPSPSRRDAVVLVRIRGAGVRGWERLVSLADKPAQRFLKLNEHVLRLTTGTAADGLVLRAPRAVDWPRPYTVAPNPDTISVYQRESPTGGHPLRYEFSELVVAPSAVRASTSLAERAWERRRCMRRARGPRSSARTPSSRRSSSSPPASSSAGRRSCTPAAG